MVEVAAMGVVVKDRQRKQGWERLLYKAIEDASSKTFELGKFDCCIFAFEVISLISTRSIFIDPHGAYNNFKTMQEFWRQHGTTLEDAITKALKLVPTNVVWAQRGDVVLLQDKKNLEHIGICVGYQSVVPQPNSKLLYIETSSFKSCWQV